MRSPDRGLLSNWRSSETDAASVLTTVILVAGIAAHSPPRRAAATAPQALWRKG